MSTANLNTRLLRVGELARRVNKTTRALRFYEELDLLTPAQRTAGGFRLYHPDTLTRIHWIDRLQELGFSLHDIRSFLDTFRGAAPQLLHREARRDPRRAHPAEEPGVRPPAQPDLPGGLPRLRAGHPPLRLPLLQRRARERRARHGLRRRLSDLRIPEAHARSDPHLPRQPRHHSL